MANLIGQTLLNRYRVAELLGHGGMAQVYKTWDQQRTVFLAMKVLHDDLARDKVFLRRFAREAQILDKLQHPHIVRFYGLEQEGLQAFLLMDYIQGSTLRDEIFQLDQAMTGMRILEIIRPICSALHYAHQMGLVHCDIKPANIMIQSNGNVLVADFGIARLIENSTTTTMAGAGTPAYMSPEQVLGKKPSPQMDVYALGIMLYEMLTGGERPFTGDQAQEGGSTAEKVRWEHLQVKPPSPKEYNPAISRNLERVVLKCLEKDPSQRYASALELLQAFGTALGSVEDMQDFISVPPQIEKNNEAKKYSLPVEKSVARKPEKAESRKEIWIPSAPTSKSSTRTEGWLVMGVLALVLFIGFIVLTNQGTAQPNASTANTIATSALQTALSAITQTAFANDATQTPMATQAPAATVTSDSPVTLLSAEPPVGNFFDGGNFTLIYSDQFELVDYTLQNGKTNGLMVLTLIDERFYANTNLSEAYFLLKSSADAQIVATCTDPNPKGGMYERVKMKENGYIFTNSSAGGQGAGIIYTENIYRVVERGVCYEAIYNISFGSIGMYGPGVKEYDHEGLFRKFTGILSTFLVK